MSRKGKDILKRFQKRWQFLLWLEVFLYATSSAVFVWFLSFSLLLSIFTAILVFLIVMVLERPWKIDLKRVSKFIDQKSNKLEYSSGLLLQPTEGLPGLAKLQQQKVAKEVEGESKKIQPENNLKTVAITSVVMIGIGFCAFYFGLTESYLSKEKNIPEEEIIVFRPIDSTFIKSEVPVLKEQQLTINYPAYTGATASISSKMDIKAVEGSRVSWKLGFEGAVDSVSIESMGRRRPLKNNNGEYSGSSVLENSGFYNFRFTDTAGNAYVSDLFAIEVTKDKAPVILLEDLKQFTSFNYDDKKLINFSASITDDFGVADAYIIATVSKGTGESVKFREEKLSFNNSVIRGKKKLNLAKNINLDQMKMEPGDELYFYVEARDLKQPQANIARSETHFAVIKDTVDYGPGVEGGLGVDLMPDYFRSQRQLIIDTEKLISQRDELSKEEFNTTSNNLGFDQKALRLKYGQFMGDEAEGGMETGGETSGENNEDPLADYTHDHDGNNEHNLVEEDEHDHGEDPDEEDPLADYLHNHSDPESSTLFTDNLKSKLRQALNIMWDAELHLRLYEPEKSLPFQYEALELIQEIKNSARIYVHRIGFDPPPIKEDARLSGELEEVDNFSKKEELEEPDKYLFIRESILRLEELKALSSEISKNDRELFEKAGNELAEKAISEPGKYLNTLQQLKRLAEEEQIGQGLLAEVQKGLLQALPKDSPEPGKRSIFGGKLNDLLLKELELNGQ
ncbi:tryptophan-rich sensory protein [Salegentibacter sp. JZCK2]|uniref:tryptophan-rich sensory protein n=1 Tax=Salegentibacter tibetensis TaxID=2873600 RepID=UPI001CCA2427|nr:tryptophan-rich sensory protein [Salegentibacter tibetensis]MBZ9729390.1 tryptophan-rich sensory protein [Salegentibacter tibetensis]